jgi:hypothetical protein
MASKKSEDTSFANLVARLNQMSNLTPAQERASLMEAASNEPRILDQKEVSLADIAKLAGIKEYQEPVKVSKKAEQLVETITKAPTEESIITKAIAESDADDSIATSIKKDVTEEVKRLDKITELETQLAQLKAQEKQEATLDDKTFRETFVNEITSYVKEADASELAELYNSFSANEVEVREDTFLIKTPETKEIIADAEKAEVKDDEVVQEQPAEEASGHEGGAEAHGHEITLGGDFTQEEPVSDEQAEMVKKILADAGITADVHPAENKFDKVHVATMSDKEAVIKALGDAVDETAGIKFTNDLSESK